MILLAANCVDVNDRAATVVIRQALIVVVLGLQWGKMCLVNTELHYILSGSVIVWAYHYYLVIVLLHEQHKIFVFQKMSFSWTIL